MSRHGGSDELHEIEVYVHAVGERAVLASADGTEANSGWLPLALIEVEKTSFGRGMVVKISAPEWLLIKEGLV